VVFGKQVPRTTAALKLQATPVPLSKLKQGDLVFFTISSSKADHAGIFMWDHYFLHTSTSKGVMISSLQETYWKKYLAGAGRF
jgi:lipoprotein Spr